MQTHLWRRRSSCYESVISSADRVYLCPGLSLTGWSHNLAVKHVHAYLWLSPKSCLHDVWVTCTTWFCSSLFLLPNESARVYLQHREGTEIHTVLFSLITCTDKWSIEVDIWISHETRVFRFSPGWGMLDLRTLTWQLFNSLHLCWK